MTQKEDNDQAVEGGFREGLARGISQALVYSIEAKKSLLQICCAPHVPPKRPLQVIRGMLESAITSAIVFGMYFTSYNHIGMMNPLAGPISSFLTSLVKIPISNGMRMVHVNKADSLLGAIKRIIKLNGSCGLYNGYGLYLLEDVIEFDMRTRLYTSFKTDNMVTNVGYGALSGMAAAYFTTPFDTIKANMTVHNTNVVHACKNIISTSGIKGLYRGGTMRMYSNCIKYTMYFMMFELMALT